MSATIDPMKGYEGGQITRRNLLISLSTMVMTPPGLLAQLRSAPFKTRALNHVTITVSDPKRSLECYQRIFGMPIQATQAAINVLRVGSGPQSHIIAGVGKSGTPGINHFCMTVDGFNPERMIKTLADLGVAGGRIRMRGEVDGGGGPGAPEGTPELTFRDPDNITVQLQDVGYCGGSGALGSVCP